MTNIDYLAYSKPKRAIIQTRDFFINLPKKTWNFLKSIPSLLFKLLLKIISPLIFLKDAFIYGDIKTKLSFLVMGTGTFLRGKVIRGFLYLLFEGAFICFMSLFGWKYLSLFGSLGTKVGTEVWDEAQGMYVYSQGDNSMLILLYGTVSIIVILGFLFTYYSNIRESFMLEQTQKVNGKIDNFVKDIKNLKNSKYHKTLLTLPMLGLVIFTIIPLIFMIFIAFTNWDKANLPPEHLFTWVGLANFDTLLGGSGMGRNSLFAYTFQDALIWTLVWAFFATFTNYIFGMLLALLINKKGIKAKKIWRTALITTIAVPQFVSLLLISQMFSSTGFVNGFLSLIGFKNVNVSYALNTIWARCFVILINMWVGIPYTVLYCTGILMNIPSDLYESAKIDGASPFKMYMNITLPYMMFVLGPQLISQFIGNINNFNVIFLLTGGTPVNSDKFIAGDTDLLITWLYKLTVNENNYRMASTIGILVFIIVAVISLIFYNRSSSVKNEEDFQ